jgi:FKBP-type peptidyl-prolyl cis-trans isomerase FklB
MRWTMMTMAVLASSIALGSCKAEAPKQVQGTGYDLSAAANEKYLADNAAKPGVTRLPSGLEYRVIKTGSGNSPKSGSDIVTVTYKGSLIDGRVFDQTAPGQTASFPAGRLIAGWVEALPLMKEGDEWELVVPASLGYGAEGAGNDIPPNATLIFDLTLVQVAPAGAQ